MKQIILNLIGLLVLYTSNAQDIAKQIENNNRFAFDLYQYVYMAEENLFFSPFSVSTAMAMAYQGSAGTTKDQIAEYLHFSNDKVENLKNFNDIIINLQNNQTDEYIMKIANSGWVQYDFNILQNYLDAIQSYFSAPFEKVDFKDPVNREKARIQINDWTADQTNQKIKDLISEGMLEDITKLVLVNAVYFKAGWKLAFIKTETKPDTFYGIKKSSEKEFMYVESQMKYAEDNGVRFLEIPYIDEKASMLIFLPDDTDKFFDLQYNLDYDYLTVMAGKANPVMVELWLPKFKIEYKKDLSETFFKNGMILPFSESANFSDITAQNNIMISNIIHQTYITVDESGTEAAASTAVIWKTKSIQKIVKFNVNRPFIFLIRDNLTQSILFMGQLVE